MAFNRRKVSKKTMNDGKMNGNQLSLFEKQESWEGLVLLLHELSLSMAKETGGTIKIYTQMRNMKCNDGSIAFTQVVVRGYQD